MFVEQPLATLVSAKYFFTDLGKAKGCYTNTIVIHSLKVYVILFLPWLYGAVTPKQLEKVLPVKLDGVVPVDNRH